MSVQVIERRKMLKDEIKTIDRIRNDAPQISYSSEGRLTIRIPQIGGDTLIVLDRPLSKLLIGFCKNAIIENSSQVYCKECQQAIDDELPF